MSGRSHTPAKGAFLTREPRVQIPHSPPSAKKRLALYRDLRGANPSLSAKSKKKTALLVVFLIWGFELDKGWGQIAVHSGTVIEALAATDTASAARAAGCGEKTAFNFKQAFFYIAFSVFKFAQASSCKLVPAHYFTPAIIGPSVITIARHIILLLCRIRGDVCDRKLFRTVRKCRSVFRHCRRGRVLRVHLFLRVDLDSPLDRVDLRVRVGCRSSVFCRGRGRNHRCCCQTFCFPPYFI